MTRQETTNVVEVVKKGESSYTVGGNVNWCSHFGKQCGDSSKNNNRATYNPAISLLGIYPKDTDVVKRRAICNPVFTAATSTTAKMWKEPRCPSTDDG